MGLFVAIFAARGDAALRDVELGGLVAWAELDALFKPGRPTIQLIRERIFSTALKLDFTHEHYRCLCSRSGLIKLLELPCGYSPKAVPDRRNALFWR